jgi:hypothetical protein
MEAIKFTESNEEFIIQNLLSIRIEASAFLPSAAVPENRGLRNRIRPSHPDREKVKMIDVFTWMLDSAVWSAVSVEGASTHDHVTVILRADFPHNSAEATRKQGVPRIDEPENLASRSGKATIQPMSLSVILFNEELKDLRESLNEILPDLNRVVFRAGVLDENFERPIILIGQTS